MLLQLTKLQDSRFTCVAADEEECQTRSMFNLITPERKYRSTAEFTSNKMDPTINAQRSRVSAA